MPQLTFAPRTDLNAAAYLIEILIAEGLFLGAYHKRPVFAARTAGACLALVLAGTLTGIPAHGSVLRFLWFLTAMCLSIAAACFCYREDLFTLISACVAGFAAQHIANKVTILVSMLPTAAMITSRSTAMRMLLEVLVFAYVYLIIYLVFGRRQKTREISIHLKTLAVCIVLTCIGVNRLVVDNEQVDVSLEIAAAIYAILCCLFALIIQFTVSRWQEAETDRLMTAQLYTESAKQYEQWSVNAGMIKVWIHDLRHLMNRIERVGSAGTADSTSVPDISAIRSAVDRMSPTVRTGNDTLDTLLRNTDDLCRQNRIYLQCVAYADCLKDLDGMKLYFLFANAIDNAIEGVSAIEDPEKRLIDISVRAFGDCAAIRFWNYYAGQITFENGLPASRHKEEGHGYGMKSMQRIVDEFDGVMNAHTEGEIFRLDIMLPIPSGGDA